MKTLCALLLTTGLLLGCSSTDVITDYNPRANFAAYQKYNWATPPDTKSGELQQDTPFLQDQFRASLAQQLKTHLYQQVDSAETADFTVRYYLLDAANSISRSPRLGIGLGSFTGNLGISTSVGIPLGKDSVHRNVQLIIDLLDAASGKLSWRGSLVIELDDRDPKLNRQRIDEAVSEIWAQFPPR